MGVTAPRSGGIGKAYRQTLLAARNLTWRLHAAGRLIFDPGSIAGWFVLPLTEEGVETLIPQGLQECQVGDAGLGLVVVVTGDDGLPIDLRTASAKALRLRAPDGTGAVKAAAFLTDGSDGQLVYVTAAGDLTQAGVWTVQAVVTLAGQARATAVAYFTVRTNLPPPPTP